MACGNTYLWNLTDLLFCLKILHTYRCLLNPEIADQPLHGSSPINGLHRFIRLSGVSAADRHIPVLFHPNIRHISHSFPSPLSGFSIPVQKKSIAVKPHLPGTA